MKLNIQEKVDLAMIWMDKPCRGEPCDLDAPCDRHIKTEEILHRYIKIKESK